MNAAITVHGHKKSLPAQAPVGAFLDLSILAAAPVRMIRSGLGDSLCRATAQADWLLSHLLFDLPYRTMPFVLLAEDEPDLFASAEALVNGDLDAMEKLVRTLLLSGFGTAICGNSLPASQGEHLISHYGDMLPDAGRPFTFHGEQIGVTTLTMARLQGRLLDGPPPTVSADRNTEADFIARFGPTLGPSCWSDFSQKRLTDGQGGARQPEDRGQMAGDPRRDRCDLPACRHAGAGAPGGECPACARGSGLAARLLPGGGPPCARDPQPLHVPGSRRR